MDRDTLAAQVALCERFGVEHHATPSDSKVGVAANVRDDLNPLNGLRHMGDVGITGWFVWAGEQFSEADDFFLPLHVAHLREWRPQVLPYLGLPPGWRFLIAPGYEDVWFDPGLLTP